MTPAFDTALASWLTQAQNIVTTRYQGPFTPPPLSLEPGRRYIRVVRDTGDRRSAHCFIDTTTGDVLKADSWKKPAPSPRGNIFTDQPGVDEYGALTYR